LLSELNQITKHPYANLKRIKTSVIWKHASSIYTCFRWCWNHITLSWNRNVRFFSSAETFSTWQGQAARFPDALKSNSLQPKLLPSTKFAVSTGCTGNQNPLDAALQMTVPQTRYSNPCARYQTPTSAGPKSSQRDAQIRRNRGWKLETRSPITSEQLWTIFPLKEMPGEITGGNTYFTKRFDTAPYGPRTASFMPYSLLTTE
jgi:hypothetical protein